MTSKEYTEYDRLTNDMEFDFIVLTSEFLLHCEHIIFGEDVQSQSKILLLPSIQ